MTDKRKTALYIRVSTDAQAEEGYSVEAQMEKLEAWCKIKNYKNTEFYIDGGWSGSNIDRPELKRMMADIARGEVAAVVVYKLDRLSRSQKDTLFLLEDVFAPNNCDFISINENFDTTSPYGKAMIGILSVFAQLERENIRERTRMGMQERVKSGLWMGGDAIPFGYDYDQNQGILVPNAHADDVRNMFKLYLQGYSTTKLASMFDVYSDKQVGNILERVTYLGKISYRGEIYDGKHEALIDQETFDKVQEQRKLRSVKTSSNSNYLLTGLLVCGKCGAKMRYQKWSGSTVKIVCYSTQGSSKAHLVKDPNCDNPRFDSRDVEQVVLEDFFRTTRQISAKAKKLNAPVSNLEILEKRYAAQQSKFRRIMTLYANDDSDWFLDSLTEAKDALEAISAELDQERKKVAAIQEVNAQNALLADVESNWGSMSQLERQQILRKTIKSIVLTDEYVDVNYYYDTPSDEEG